MFDAQDWKINSETEHTETTTRGVTSSHPLRNNTPVEFRCLIPEDYPHVLPNPKIQFFANLFYRCGGRKSSINFNEKFF